MRSNITSAKKQFNRFFQDDLYGSYDSAENLILSRGSWNDNTLALPRLFKFCTAYTLKKHWVGYSDSLGHENVYRSLVKRFSFEIPNNGYGDGNFALTMGNVATMGFVYKQLTKLVNTDRKVVTTAPYYPSILKTISSYYEKVEFVNSLQPEELILQTLLRQIDGKNDVGVIHLSNFIGVEGRIYSTDFWKTIILAAHKQGIYIVIDEGLWYDKREYPDEITLSNVIRLVSPSKKYGIPGMKLGFLIADSSFIAAYYEEASSGYGGPASMFFLLLEVLILFEYIHMSNDDSAYQQLTETYPDISKRTIKRLYKDYCLCLQTNFNLYDNNKQIVEAWCRNNNFVKKAYLYDGLNYFIKLNHRGNKKMYPFFLSLIQSERVSVMPSSCFGDPQDEYMRISILEDTPVLTEGLARITRFLNENELAEAKH